MARLIVNNIDDALLARLKRRAALNGRTLEEEVRGMLRTAVQDENRSTDGLGTRIAQRFAGRGIDFAIPEFRGEPTSPQTFKE
jgi:plasmid stability protein